MSIARHLWCTWPFGKKKRYWCIQKDGPRSRTKSKSKPYYLTRYNVVATWLRHMISLVITFNDIPLSLPITLTYHLVPDDSPFWCTKPHLSIIGNWPSYIALLGSVPAVILFIGKRTGYHPICWEAYHPLSYFVRTHFSCSSSAPPYDY